MEIACFLKYLKYYYYSAEKISRETSRVWLDKFYDGEESNILYSKQQQTVVLMIDGRYIHGGLTDRLRGIVATFLWATNHGYTFKINWTFPYSLVQFLKPNKIDWFIDSSELQYEKQISKPICLYDYRMPHQDRLFNRLMNKFVDGKHRQYHVYSNIDGFEDKYGNAIHELFSPSQEIQKEIQTNISLLGENFCSITLRFQELLGDFKENGEWKTLESEQQTYLINKCIKKIQEIYKKEIQSGKLLLTSDSKKFLDIASKELSFVYVIPGKLSHLDYKLNSGNTFEHMKSFIDMFVLSKAKKSYLLVTDDMYRSNFARYASLLGNVQYEEIIF